LDFAYLFLGIVCLLVGTELTVSSALVIAKRHGLSEFFVGLIVLSIGSDLPEVAVAIDAGLMSLLDQDASGVVVGTSIGSVIAQIGFVLGLGGLMTYLTLPRRFIFRHGAILLGATVLLFLAGFDGVISRIEGLTLITFYIIYLVVLLSRETVPEDAPTTVTGNTAWPWIRMIIGLSAVVGGSELTVTSVVSLAYTFDISEAIISVLIIGLGTSLPELAISVAAIMKKKVHLSVGNIIGSNIFDTLVPISAAALITPVIFTSDFLAFDLPFAFVLTLVVLYLFDRKSGLQKSEAGMILALYFFYVLVKIAQL
jgi:cation:H+ antiporter